MRISYLLARLSPTRLVRTAVAWAFLGSFLRCGGAILLLPLIARYMPAKHLGIWYVFVSMGGLILLIDEGVSVSVSRAAAYLWTGAEDLLSFGIAPLKQADGVGPNKDGMHSLVRTLVWYYRLFATVCFAILAAIGSAWIWHLTRDLPDAGILRTAWLVYSFGYCLSLSGLLWPALLSGINEVCRAQRILTIGSIINYAVAAAGLILHFGIWSLAAGSLLMAIFTRAAAMRAFHRATGNAFRQRNAKGLQWPLLGKLWPNSWRLGICGVGAYLSVPATVLICSAFIDLETTGSLGLSLQLLTKLVALSAVWLLVKIPELNRFRAQDEVRRLIAVSVTRIRLSVLTFVLGAAAIIVLAPGLLKITGAQTLLLPGPLLVLLSATLLLALQQSLHGHLILTENRNPFALAQLFTGMGAVILAVILAPRFNLNGILLASFIVPLLYLDWWIVLRAVSGLGIKPLAYLRLFFRGRVVC
jgi:O-antigen/teichoic acid export membrane protein